jgi:hypothetical protein
VLAALAGQVRALCRPLLPAQRIPLRGGAALLAARELADIGRVHAAQAFLLPESVLSDGSGSYFGALGEAMPHPRLQQLARLHLLRRDALATAWNAALARCHDKAAAEGAGEGGEVAWPTSADAAALAAAEAEAEAQARALPALDEEGQAIGELPSGWVLSLAALLPPTRTTSWHATARRAHSWCLAMQARPRDALALLPW